MAISNFEDISQVKKKIFVTLSREEVDREYQTTLREYARKVKVKGFRPGKVPLSIVERFYGKSIQEETRDRLVQRSFEDLLKEKGISPVGIPLLERGDLRKGEGYSYMVELEVKPQFELPNYKGIEVKKEKPVVTEEMVEARLREIQRQYGRLEDIGEERGVRPDDKVVVKVNVLELGGEKKQEEERIVTIDLADQDVETVWREELIGKAVGDKGVIRITFPQEHPNKDLRGKEVATSYEIISIKKLVLPELDDEFAKTVSSKFENLTDLKARIKEILEESEKKRVEGQAIEQLLTSILEKVQFELPESLVTNQINSYIENMYVQIQSAGGDPASVLGPMDKVVEELRPRAEREVKEMLVLADIAKKEGIEVDQEDLLRALSAQSAMSGQSVEALLEYYQSKGMLGQLRYRILRDKTLKYLLENAKIQEEGGPLESANDQESQNGGEIKAC